MSAAGTALPAGGGLAAWVRLLRPHHATLTLGTGLVGMAATWESPGVASAAVGVAICASGYSIGQLANDYFDRAADAVNAPSRPLVSGAVDPRAALGVSIAASLAMLGAALAVAPAVAAWVVVALALHGLYTVTKGIPMLGNVVNGADIAVFVLIGAAAAAPERAWVDVPGAALALTGVMALALSGFCLVSYFKDVSGDAAAGYRTLVVVLGATRARWAAPPFPVAALGLAGALAVAEPGLLGAGRAGPAFWALATLAGAAYAVALAHLFADPLARAYETFVWYTRATLVLAAALVAAPAPALGLALTAALVAFYELAVRDTRATRQP